MGNVVDCLAENVRNLRKSRGLTQEELAERASISTQSIRYVENKLRWPSTETIRALASALQVPETTLFFDRNSETSLQTAWEIVSKAFEEHVIERKK